MDIFCISGWSWECLEDWGEFGTVIVASITMTFIFWLCTEVGTFLAGKTIINQISNVNSEELDGKLVYTK